MNARTLAVTFLAWIAFAAPGRATDDSTTHQRVAMMDFTSDDGLMRSAAGAAQWAALTQDSLANDEPGFVWIERAQLQLAANELDLAAGGFTSAAGSVRMGKWVKADLAILGSFHRNQKNEDGHTLQLDVVDLNRADTLATRTIQVAGDRRDAVTVDPALVAATVTALRDALAEADAKLARTARQKVLAPLFIRNADVSPRLDGVQAELMDALAQGAAHAGDVRVLRFPHADEARGEADLAVRGLTEGDEDAWRRVADLYVWGSYHELPAGDAALAQTPVAVELTLWDGVAAPRQINEKTVVSQVPELARRLAAQCLDAVRKVPATRPAPASVREEIARSLREQGQRLDATAASHGVRCETFLATPEGKALRNQERALLEAACFFAPLDRQAALARLQVRWEDFPRPTQRLPLLDLWRRSDDLADFATRFRGSAKADATADLTRERVEADAFLLFRLDYGEKQIHVSGSEPNLPVDASDAQIAAWHATLDARLTRDTLEYVATGPPADNPSLWVGYGEWMRTALQLMHDPASAARVAEAVWPLYKTFYWKNASREDGRYGLDKGGLPVALKELYAGLHQPEKASAMLASASSVDAPPPGAWTASVPPPVQLPRLSPRWHPLPFPLPSPTPAGPAPERQPETTFVVQNLAVDGDDLLWMSVVRRTKTFLINPRREQTQELWRHDPADESFTVLPVDGLTMESPITSILPQANSLWLTVGFLGVLQYDPANARVLRRHTVKDGLLTSNMDAAVAAPGGHLFVAGHENRRPLLNRLDAGGAGWMRVDLTAASDDMTDRTSGAIPGLQAGEDQAQVVAFQHWLLVRLGGGWTLLDEDDRRSRSLRDVLPVALVRTVATFGEKVPHSAMLPGGLPLPRPRPLTADAHGFWLVLDGKIVQFDPVHPQTARSWLLPPELADGVTALASDGDDLWMTGPPGVRAATPGTLAASLSPANQPLPGFYGRGYVAVMHETDGRWRGCFELPAAVGCLALARNSVYVDQQQTGHPLLEIDKSSTLSGVTP